MRILIAVYEDYHFVIYGLCYSIAFFFYHNLDFSRLKIYTALISLKIDHVFIS